MQIELTNRGRKLVVKEKVLVTRIGIAISDWLIASRYEPSIGNSRESNFTLDAQIDQFLGDRFRLIEDTIGYFGRIRSGVVKDIGLASTLDCRNAEQLVHEDLIIHNHRIVNFSSRRGTQIDICVNICFASGAHQELSITKGTLNGILALRHLNVLTDHHLIRYGVSVRLEKKTCYHHSVRALKGTLV